MAAKVVHLVKPQHHAKGKKPEPKPDSVFFIKAQISIGLNLICMGRLAKPSGWIVTRIISHHTNGKPMHVNTVQYLSDRIYLRRANASGTMAERSGTFGYLSYSAIWRIA
jgi:hypothetical protein